MTPPDRARACRVCGAGITPFMSFGRMPIANAFLTADQIPSEYFFELAPACCESCGMFQLLEQPSRERMFHGHYAFYSSSSQRMQEHFQAFASFAEDRGLKGRTNPLVVEIGSNDGTLLRGLKDAGYRHLGIEPSANVAAAAQASGVETHVAFFDDALAATLLSQQGPADVILAANVMCHIADIHSVASGVARWLAPDGLFIFEDPYLGDMLAATAYDQIYDEHVFIFSATSVAAAFSRHGLELVDVVPQATHGGSMRYVLARRGAERVSPDVSALLERERDQGLDRPATYDRFRRNCEASRSALCALLVTLQQQGRRVVGYAATSKSTTVTNYCGLGPELIEFIADTTPIKQGKVTPGTHIPVRAYEEFALNPPDYALLFAWNHAAEIFAKEQGFQSRGGKWITFVPRVGIIG